jgi:polyisoprenoid-binding protein YceI
MVAAMTDTTTTIPTPTLPLAPGTWSLDANHTAVGFSIKRIGWAKVRGTFTDVAVELVVGATPEQSALTAAIDLASVDTGNPDRDAHLRSPDLIDVARRPTITFRSTAIRGDGEEWEVDGELTIGDVTRPHTLEVAFEGVGLFPPDGLLHAGFSSTTEVRRKDFGLGFGAMGAGMGAAVKVELDVELVAPPAP